MTSSFLKGVREGGDIGERRSLGQDWEEEKEGRPQSVLCETKINKRKRKKKNKYNSFSENSFPVL